jgi:hypothetical protein
MYDTTGRQWGSPPLERSYPFKPLCPIGDDSFLIEAVHRISFRDLMLRLESIRLV